MKKYVICFILTISLCLALSSCAKEKQPEINISDISIFESEVKPANSFLFVNLNDNSCEEIVNLDSYFLETQNIIETVMSDYSLISPSYSKEVLKKIDRETAYSGEWFNGLINEVKSNAKYIIVGKDLSDHSNTSKYNYIAVISGNKWYMVNGSGEKLLVSSNGGKLLAEIIEEGKNQEIQFGHYAPYSITEEEIKELLK